MTPQFLQTMRRKKIIKEIFRSTIDPSIEKIKQVFNESVKHNTFQL